MKICLFSDLHGNGAAFKEFYKIIRKESADINIFLGDYCGYYFDQIEIIENFLKIPNLIAIKGNHDRMFLEILDGNEDLRFNYKNRYGNSMENLIVQTNEDFIKWIRELPDYFIFEDEKISCYHGSPWNHSDEYIYPDTDKSRFLPFASQFFFLGHTHYRMNQKIGEKTLVNPGSIGQPRDNTWPTFVILQFPKEEINFIEVQYDKRMILEQLETIGSNPKYLKEILFR